MTGGAATGTPGWASDLGPLPAGIVERLESPVDVALLVGIAASTELMSAVTRAGLEPVFVDDENAAARCAEFDSLALVLLNAGDSLDEVALDLIDELRRTHPTATILLATPSDGLDPSTLLAAMRAGISDVVDPANPLALRSILGALLARARGTRERVLAVGAHPDDVEIGCAGTLLQHRAFGDEITILTMSHGGVGGSTAQRVEESVDAAALVGARLLLGDLPDTQVDAGVSTIRLIESVLTAIDPTVIYVHSRNDNHQDHRAVHIAVISASRRVPKILAYQSPSATNDFLPTNFVAIDDVISRKVEVLSMFDSQSQRAYLEPDAVLAGARYWARHLAPRTRYAEPFEAVRTLVTDRRIGEQPKSAGSTGEDIASVTDLRTDGDAD
ncbi:MAG: PIG-L family deacetylase [Jatrophihabitans sp.]